VQVDIPRDAGVIRFRPVEPSRVMEWAAKEYRGTGHCGLSVSASVTGSGESSEAAEGRLLDAAGLDRPGRDRAWGASGVNGWIGPASGSPRIGGTITLRAISSAALPDATGGGLPIRLSGADQ
jgi:hypothetical protein